MVNFIIVLEEENMSEGAAYNESNISKYVISHYEVIMRVFT